MTVRRIVPNLVQRDPEGQRTFFESLGLTVVMDQGWIQTLAAPGSPTVQLSLLAPDASAPLRADLSVEVDDVDAVYARLGALGYPVVYPLTDEPWGVRRFFVREPGGAVVNVVGHR